MLLIRSTDIQVLYLTCIIAMNRAKGGRQLHVTTYANLTFQLIKHVLTNPSRQLSVKQARLPLESKNTSVQICQLHKKNPLLTSGSPLSQEYDDF